MRPVQWRQRRCDNRSAAANGSRAKALIQQFLGAKPISRSAFGGAAN
jgi:hypothetical protein